MSLINMIAMVVKLSPIQKSYNYKHFFMRIILYIISFLILISAYVFGAIALYYCLLPYYGQVAAAFVLCLLSLFMSLGLILTAIRLKSKKKKPSHELLPFLERSLDHLPNSEDLVKALRKASPTVLLTVFGAVAVAAYIMFSKKKDK